MSYQKRSIASTLTDSEEDEVTHKKHKSSSSSFSSSTTSHSSHSSSKLYSQFANFAESASRKVKNDEFEDLRSQFEENSTNKRIKTETTTDANASSFAQKMMRKMGHEAGKGLGKHSQGIVEPIDESDQKGKQGIGFRSNNKFSRVKESWNYEHDPVSSKEYPEWLNGHSDLMPSLETLKSWKKIGQKKRILDDEDHFCSKEILKKVLDCKSIFDDLDNKDLRQARSRSNPFESIGSVFFQNRAAMKMANIDAVFNFMFTDPRDPHTNESKVSSNEPLYFCDVCAGPGGFSEYVLWRKKWRCKGFGFTLKAENDFCLDDFLAGPPECFETHYGVNGPNGNGDVTVSDNLKEFKKFVMEQTNNLGVHFMMADGGFSVEGNENIQEILSKQLYLCQFLCALMVLRTGGNFVCKLFDVFTPFSIGLIYLMYLCFERICLHKPVTSRPANSERYIICEGALDNKSIIAEYLMLVNEDLNKYFRDNDSKLDVVSIVPLSILKDDTYFYNYVKDSNEKMGQIQCVNLNKIQVFTTNKNLYDMRQAEIFESCLAYWKIENFDRSLFVDDQPQERPQKKGRFNPKIKVRYNPNMVNPNQLLSKLSSQSIHNLSSIGFTTLKELDSNSWKECLKKSSVFDYNCTVSSGDLCLLLGCGRSVIYEINLNNSDQIKEWRRLDTNHYNIELPRDTLVLAEKCYEFKGEDKAQQHSRIIHLIDAYFICGENMIVDGRNKVIPTNERYNELNILTKSVNKPSHSLTKMKVRQVVDLARVDDLIFANLEHKKPKSQNTNFKYGIRVPFDSYDDSFIYMNGLYLFKHIATPWSIVLSKSSQKKYYYNIESRASTYDLPLENSFYAHPKSYLENGFVWRFVEDEDYNGNELRLTKYKLLDSIKSLI